jgi:cysteine desulfurase
MSAYLDCNATTPLEPRVSEVMRHYFEVEYGNSGSRTHEYGARAKQAVEEARRLVADVVGAEDDEVTFTSGATEGNNLAILGLAAHGEKTGRRHMVTSAIEHKAVLEPLEALRQRGFEITLVPPAPSGCVDPAALVAACRADTLLVSIMHVNNETGVVQPLAEICNRLARHDAFLHVDAAQGFGKELGPLASKRIDFISISAHKIYGPKGVGALIARRRSFSNPPLQPLMYGGGQEHGLRPGTLPVPLIAGLGEASRLARAEHEKRRKACLAFRRKLIAALEPLSPLFNGDPDSTLPHVLNISIPGLDSEAVMVALKGIVAISNGSACTSASYKPSHVLQAMGFSLDRIQQALRFSWCHLTPDVNWLALRETLEVLRR